MVVSCAEYGAMVCRSVAYGATVCSAGPTAITPLMAAWLAAMVVRTAIPFAPPPAAATAWACRAAGALPGGKAASLVNSGGIFPAVAMTDGGIFCAVATTSAWVVANAISVLYVVA